MSPDPGYQDVMGQEIRHHFNPDTRNVLACFFLVAAAFGVFYPAWNYGFTNYDDPMYVIENPVVQAGLSPASLREAITDQSISLWTPLTLISYQIEVELFGPDPAVMHRTNIGLHALNAVLLYALLFQLTSQFWPSFFVAVVFAVHPSHVESVAWIAERKDVLSTVFWMLASLAWVSFVRSRSTRLYGLAFALFALGLLAKPMVMTLPAAFLVLDLWPLNRLRSRADVWPAIREKVPFFVLSAASVLLTLVTQSAGGAVGERTLAERLATVVVGYISYVSKTFYPVNLSVFYPPPREGVPLEIVLASCVVLFIVTAAAVACYRRAPFFTAGWFWFVVTLIPVIGFVKIGGHAFADRYTYVTTIGLYIIAAWGVRAVSLRYKGPVFLWIAAAGGSVTVAVLVYLGNQQVRIWKDSETLFRQALLVNAKNPLAYIKLGEFYESEGDTNKAIEHFEQALAISPDNTFAHTNLALILLDRGELSNAIEHLEAALVRPYKIVESRQRLAAAYYAAENFEEAARVYRMQIADPDIRAEELDNSYFWLLRTLEMIGDTAEHASVLAEYSKRLPDSARMHFESGRAAAARGDSAIAKRFYERAVELDETFAPGWIHLGIAQGQSGDLERAVQSFREAVRSDESNAAAHQNLATALKMLGRHQEAAVHERKAAELAEVPVSLVAP